MSNKNLTIGLLITLVIAVSVVFGFRIGGKTLGGAASPSDVSSTNFTQVTANALTVNTSNTATSTTALGCVQIYATSTVTASHLEFSTTTTLATFTGGAAISGNGGAVAWVYGVCPK